MSIGIDALAIAAPEAYLELEDLAVARGVPPSKFSEGLGVRRMGIASPHEDPVALGARAGRRLLEKAGIDPARVGLLIVGTETAVDHSKPVAAWIHRLLGLGSRCRTYETKHACFGGTAGVLTATEWLASGAARGKSAVVICTDIARYELGSAGEPTQGAGAVAIHISEEPRLLELEVGVTGSFTREVDDFWRPLDRTEALVDGKLSVSSYLEALDGAFSAWREACAAAGLEGPLARRCYHVPYGKMARKAHRRALALEGFSEEAADATFDLQVAPSLRLPAEVGNIYTGSLWMALASLLDAEAAQLEGQRIGLFSYGSGSAAEQFAGRVAKGAGAFARFLQLAEPLQGRRKLTFAEYERLRRGLDAPRPQGAPAFLGVAEGRRRYS